MSDYSITWSYIVQKMEDKFGINPNSDEKFSMGEIERYIENIWNEYADAKMAQEGIK